MIHLHKPVLVGTSDPSGPPSSGDLAPHPQGPGWVAMLLQLYQIALDDGCEILPHFYYPVMARCCSDADVKGECIANFQAAVFDLGILIDRTVDCSTPVADQWLTLSLHHVCNNMCDILFMSVCFSIGGSTLTRHSPMPAQTSKAVWRPW